MITPPHSTLPRIFFETVEDLEVMKVFLLQPAQKSFIID